MIQSVPTSPFLRWLGCYDLHDDGVLSWLVAQSQTALHPHHPHVLQQLGLTQNIIDIISPIMIIVVVVAAVIKNVKGAFVSLSLLLLRVLRLILFASFLWAERWVANCAHVICRVPFNFLSMDLSCKTNVIGWKSVSIEFFGSVGLPIFLLASSTTLYNRAKLHD